MAKKKWLLLTGQEEMVKADDCME